MILNPWEKKLSLNHLSLTGNAQPANCCLSFRVDLPVLQSVTHFPPPDRTSICQYLFRLPFLPFELSFGNRVFGPPVGLCRQWLIQMPRPARSEPIVVSRVFWNGGVAQQLWLFRSVWLFMWRDEWMAGWLPFNGKHESTWKTKGLGTKVYGLWHVCVLITIKSMSVGPPLLPSRPLSGCPF